MNEEWDAPGGDGSWEKGIAHAFREAGLRRGESRLETIERVTGVSSRPHLDPGAAEESPIRRIPGLERQAIEGGDPRYVVLSEISRSCRSTVLEALDRDLGRSVALKVLPEERAADEAAAGRLVEQARIGGQLQHPGIVPVYGLGVGADGRPFFAMPLVSGGTLADVLESASGAALRDLLPIFEQVAQATAYAHARGVQHGDLTPENVVVGRFGEVLVVDWGRAVVGRELRGDVVALGTMLETILAVAGDDDAEFVALASRCVVPAPQHGPANAGDVATAVSLRLAAREKEAQRAELDAALEQARVATERARAAAEQRQFEWERSTRLRTLAAAVAVLLALIGGGALALVKAGEDRAAQEGAEAGVADAMGKAARSEGAGDLATALIWARKAVALARAGGAIDATVQGADDLLARLAHMDLLEREDAALLDRLEEIQLQVLSGTVGSADLDQRFREAFLESGIDVETMSVEEAADAILLRTCPQDLVAAIDGWVLLPRSREDLVVADAERLLAIARAADPDEWRNRVRGAILDLDLEAVQTLAASIDAGRAPARTIYLVAVLLREVGEQAAAVDVLHQGIRQHPQDASLLELLARCLKRLTPPRRAEAVTYYYEALAVLPDAPRLWNGLGIVLGDLGEMDDAVAAFRRTLDLVPNYASAQTNIGVVRFKQGQFEEAIAAFRAAVEIAPGDATSHTNLGATLNRTGQSAEALEAHRKAYELKPDELLVNFNLGLQHHQMGDPAEAIPYLRRATELAPRHIPSRVMLGVVLAEAGRHEETVTVLEETLAFKPDAVGVLHNLALLLISCPDERLRDYEKAVTYAERAVRRRDHPDQWELLSLARLRAGHHVAAIEAAERALAPGGRVRADCLLVLAVSHAKLGHRDDAREWLSKAVAWMAEHPPNEEIESLRSEAEAALGQER